MSPATTSTSSRGSEFKLVQSYSFGYRNREDVTMLSPGVLVSGSHDVITNVQGRIQSRRGYVIDGQTDASNAPILSAFDWPRHTGDVKHLRAGFNSTGSNGQLQFRYVDPDDDVTWLPILTDLDSSRFNFANFWDFNTELKDLLLMVNGQQIVYEWTGAVAHWVSATNASGVISVLNSTPTSGGTGYVVGDVLTITTGGSGATAQVLTVDGSGAITAIALVTPGSGYSTGSGKATTGGSGSSATLDITTVVQGYIQLDADVGSSGYYTNAANLPATVTIWDATLTTSTDFTYSGFVGDYLVGISADATGYVADDPVVQKVNVKTSSDFTGLPTSDLFTYDLIENLKNQIYLGCLTFNSVYVSKVNDYMDFSFSTPTRVVGDGTRFDLDGPPVAFIPQEQSMYISASKDQWYETQFQVSSDLANELMSVQRLKTTARQAVQSQAFTTKIRDNVAFLSNEPIISTIGRVDNVVLTPQITDISFPIVNDMNAYDFTDGCSFYWRNFYIVSVPKQGIVRFYNMTNNIRGPDGNNNFYWEAPQTMPFSRFSIIDGELYGHSYLTSESYKMFDGFSDNGNSINAKAVFSFNQYGVRNMTKSYNEFYIEGYISENTRINVGIQYDIDGCATQTATRISGDDRQIVCLISELNSLGKNAIGKQPLGGNTFVTSGTDTLPPKFRVIKTFTRRPFYEDQISFESTGPDQNWQIIAFGPNVNLTTENQATITQ